MLNHLNTFVEFNIYIAILVVACALLYTQEKKNVTFKFMWLGLTLVLSWLGFYYTGTVTTVTSNSTLHIHTPAYTLINRNVSTYCIYDQNILNIPAGQQRADDNLTADQTFPPNTPDYVEEANEIIECPPTNTMVLYPQVNSTYSYSNVITTQTGTDLGVLGNAFGLVVFFTVLYLIYQIVQGNSLVEGK